MRGYFSIGVEGLSKPINAGNLFRSAHAFGASFVFTIAAEARILRSRADTSRTDDNLPWYNFTSVNEMRLPEDCHLVGVELTDDAIELPSFKHPIKAAYVLGAERSSLSAQLQARCRHMVKIPTSFCINVGTAGAIVMYDRLLNLGRFAERPISTLQKPVQRTAHAHGDPIFRNADPRPK